MINYTLKELEIFESVARNNSFTMAAAELYLSQSSVSAAISSLEKELNVQLFDRTAKKKMYLTEEGRKKYDIISSILTQCSAISSSEEQNEIKIGSSTVPSLAILPELIALFSTLHPECKISMVESDSQGVYEHLKSGDISVGFVGSRVSNPNIIFEEIAKDQLIVIAPDTEEYRELKEQGVYGNSLLFRPMIQRVNGSGTLSEFETYARSKGIDPTRFHIAARMSSPKSIENAVAAGLGIAVVSDRSVNKRKNGIIRFPMNADGLYRSLGIVYLKHKHFNASCQEFLEYAKNTSRYEM